MVAGPTTEMAHERSIGHRRTLRRTLSVKAVELDPPIGRTPRRVRTNCTPVKAPYANFSSPQAIQHLTAGHSERTAPNSIQLSVSSPWRK
jgi:hypothetical protein